MLQSTAVWGVYGLSIITAFLTFIPFLMLDKKYRLLAPAIAIFVIGGIFYYGNYRMPESAGFVEGVNLRIVHPNIKQQDKWPAKNWGKNLITYMGMSDDERLPGTTHVIWPETAVIYSLSEEPFRRQLISRVLGKGGNLLTGFPRRMRGQGRTKIYNSFIAIGDQGEIAGIYDKSHLVPFGEYLPAFIKNILIPLGLDQVFPGGQGFNEGEGVKTLNIPGLPPFGVLICYEIIFPGQVVDIKNRPDWLLNITNDAWYGNSSGPRQHLLQTRVRAIEEGLPVIRSAGTGMSAVIDPYGRILDKLPLNRKGVIFSELPNKISTMTYYSLYKEWIFACINVILIIVNIVLMGRFSTIRR
ncbi:MAG: apolipoprotein N-acyltransferase [Emcibacteraceae bacterium]|nr:apolipoprotein N-acyltransferase [Emcibacteraceae bacterium]